MNYTIWAISVIAGVFVLGVAGFYQFSDAEIETEFVCNPNQKNGHVVCSESPEIGERGLFFIDSKNSCPIDVSFIIENRMVVEFGDSPDCKYNEGLTLALTIDN